MAEYIERESAYEDFEKCNSKNPKWTPSRVKTLITRQKAVDAVEVVRCKNCKHRYEDSWCEYVDDDDNFYCARGERKEGQA